VDVDADLLKMCGYALIYEKVMKAGQMTAAGLLCAWQRVAVTVEEVGEEGSALGPVSIVRLWGKGKGDMQDEAVMRFFFRLKSDGTYTASLFNTPEGSSGKTMLMDLEIPTPLEMLACQADYGEESSEPQKSEP